MSLRLRILLGSVALVGVALAAMAWLVVRDVRPHTFGATEDSLVETAVVLTALLEADPGPDPIPLERIRAILDVALHRPLDARIYALEKRAVELRVYVTDARGIVVYDSDQGRDEGRDYSRWRDVRRALEGRYGSRASRRDRRDPFSAVFYVTLPIRRAGRIAGVLAVGKQAHDVKLFVAGLNRSILVAGLAALLAAVVAGLALSEWISRPIHRLGRYARSVGEGHRPPLPRLPAREIAEVGRAFESMRDALDGRRDVEGYVRSLTHETKAPLSAIRASAELLEEGLPVADQRRFLASIRAEVSRLQQLVDRILELSALEARRTLTDVAALDLAEIGRDVAESLAPLLEQKRLALAVRLDGLPRVRGDRLLVGQALTNLVHNALRWTPPGGAIRVEGAAESRGVVLTVTDSGSGVPDYALPRVFEKFYSVPLPGGDRGSGLGLPFVREVALLHGGDAALENRSEGGARATLRLALDPAGGAPPSAT